jgi:hypothetical protein
MPATRISHRDTGSKEPYFGNMNNVTLWDGTVAVCLPEDQSTLAEENRLCQISSRGE